MLRNVRRGVFETNSSSMHSLSLGGSAPQDPEGGHVAGFVPDGRTVIEFGEYGWEWGTYSRPWDKLAYVLTAIQYLDSDLEFHTPDYKFVGIEEARRRLEANRHYRWLQEMVKDYTGAELDVEFIGSGWDAAGSIDHQSCGMLAEENVWSEDEATFKSDLRDLVFGGAVITTDNDNH